METSSSISVGPLISYQRYGNSNVHTPQIDCFCTCFYTYVRPWFALNLLYIHISRSTILAGALSLQYWHYCNLCIQYWVSVCDDTYSFVVDRSRKHVSPHSNIYGGLLSWSSTTKRGEAKKKSCMHFALCMHVQKYIWFYLCVRRQCITSTYFIWLSSRGSFNILNWKG